MTAPGGAVGQQRIALVDLLDRVLATGVVVSGEVVLSIAGVDLVQVSLRALLASVRAGVPGPDHVQQIAQLDERQQRHG